MTDQGNEMEFGGGRAESNRSSRRKRKKRLEQRDASHSEDTEAGGGKCTSQLRCSPPIKVRRSRRIRNDVTISYGYSRAASTVQSVNRRRAPCRTSCSQRSSASSNPQFRQMNKPQSRSKDEASRKEAEDEEEKHGRLEKESMPLGTCQTMCPACELADREAKRRLHLFEMLPGTESDHKPRGDPLRAVKEYSRPAAGKDFANPSILRPPAVLLSTVCYLIDNIASSPSLHPWTEVYGFVFDRLRAVKQDMIIQRVSGKVCVAILELTVRFLIYASYHLCGQPLHLYDPVINDRHLQENLSWLLDCYSTETGPHPNQEEFQALGLLYNLGSHRARQHVIELPEQLRSSPSIRLALSINQAFLERNPVRLLRLADKLSFLQGCALHRHFSTSCRDLLLIYSHGYSSRNCRFPLDLLARLLSLDVTVTAEFCRMFGVHVRQGDKVAFSKAAFTDPERGHMYCDLCHSIVSDKQKDLTLGNVFHGSA